MSCRGFLPKLTKFFRYLKWRYSPIEAVCKAYVRESPSPKQPCKVQYLQIRYLKFLVTKQWSQVSNDQDPCSSLLLLVEPISSSLDEDCAIHGCDIWESQHVVWGLRPDILVGFLVTQSGDENTDVFFGLLNIKWCSFFFINQHGVCLGTM